MSKSLLLFFPLLPLASLLAQEPPFDPAAFYLTNCAACHGIDLKGASASSLVDDTFLYGPSRNLHARNILYGIPGTDMAGFKPLLGREHVDELVDYLFSRPETVSNTLKILPSTLQTEKGEIVLREWITDGLSTPWGIEFTGPDSALVTERPGNLRIIANGILDSHPVNGLPEVYAHSDGGMMDLALDPDYARNGWIYLGFSHALGDPKDRSAKAMTKIVRGRIVDREWIDEQTLFKVPDELYHSSPNRWGCRFLWGPEGSLYFSIGDRGREADSQDLGKPAGKVYRIRPDGSIPGNNPFAQRDGALAAIYTYGNRNAQGLSIDPDTGYLWESEHGPMGGDELNILEAGANYGWPIATYGRGYDGSVVSENAELADVVPPVHQWTPSIAVCPLEFYSGDTIASWTGDLFVGALAFERLLRFEIDGRQVVSQEILLSNQGRVRDIKTGPEGDLYVVLNDPDKIIRLSR